LANDETAEGDWKRRGVYTGPVFNDLEEGVVDAWHKYIEERGFDAQLSEFVAAACCLQGRQGIRLLVGKHVQVPQSLSKINEHIIFYKLFYRFILTPSFFYHPSKSGS